MCGVPVPMLAAIATHPPLTDNTFEDVEPVAVLESRNEGDEGEYLVKFHDSEEVRIVWESHISAGCHVLSAGKTESLQRRLQHVYAVQGDPSMLSSLASTAQPVWVAAKYVAEDVVQDFDAGLEYAQGVAILDMRQRGDSRAYLVRCVSGNRRVDEFVPP